MQPKNMISDYESQRGGNGSVKKNELVFVFYFLIIPMSTSIIELGSD